MSPSSGPAVVFLFYFFFSGFDPWPYESAADYSPNSDILCLLGPEASVVSRNDLLDQWN